MRGMSYPSDLTDEQWDLLDPASNAPGKRGRRHADDLRVVVNTMLHIGRPGVSGGTCRSRSDPGPGPGRSSAAGRATAPGHEPSRCRTRLRAWRTAAKNRANQLMREHLTTQASPMAASVAPPSCEIVREHHHFSYGLAPSRLHRDHPSSPLTDTT